MTKKTFRLDTQDLEILSILQKEGNITKVDLAKRIGLSVSPCWERVKKLEASGLIKSYHATVDFNKLIDTVEFFVEIYLDSYNNQDCDLFENAIKEEPYVTECYALAGRVDYLIRVVAPSTSEYQEIMNKLLSRNLGIKSYVSNLITKFVKPYRGHPVIELLEETPHVKRRDSLI